jgi:hypothetical protein
MSWTLCYIDHLHCKLLTIFVDKSNPMVQSILADFFFIMRIKTMKIPMYINNLILFWRMSLLSDTRDSHHFLLNHFLGPKDKPDGPHLSSFSDFLESFERKYCPFGLALCINWARILFVGMLWVLCVEMVNWCKLPWNGTMYSNFWLLVF